MPKTGGDANTMVPEIPNFSSMADKKNLNLWVTCLKNPQYAFMNVRKKMKWEFKGVQTLHKFIE